MHCDKGCLCKDLFFLQMIVMFELILKICTFKHILAKFKIYKNIYQDFAMAFPVSNFL